MSFADIIEKIKRAFGQSDNSDLMLGEYFSKEILRQYKKLIKHINKELKKSLKEYPYAHSEFEICIQNKDLRKAIIELYKKQGFKVEQPIEYNKSYITITFDGWEK